MDAIRTNAQIVSFRDLLSSTLVATVDADTATSQRYFTNMCDIAFEHYDIETNEAGNFRTLTFQYIDTDGLIHVLNIPVISLVPLPLLQVKDADFEFNVSIVSIFFPSEKDSFSLEERQQPNEPPQLRIALQSFNPAIRSEGGYAGSYLLNMKVNIRLHQSDMPGGLSRFLQFVNNAELKSNVEKINNDAKHE